MPIDTENKRRSVLGILPVPDGSIDAQDRRQVLGLYRMYEVAAVGGQPNWEAGAGESLGFEAAAGESLEFVAGEGSS